jgi:hypothetical protein
LTDSQHGTLEEIQQRNAMLEKEREELKDSLQRREDGTKGFHCAYSRDHDGLQRLSGHSSWQCHPGESMSDYLSAGGWSPSFPNSISSVTSFANGYGKGFPGPYLSPEMGLQFNRPLEQLGQSMMAVGRGAGTYQIFPVMIHF